MKSSGLIFNCLVILFFAVRLPAQQPAAGSGAALLASGRYADAVAALKTEVKRPEGKSNAESWNYLGIAYVNLGQLADGRKALERAVKLAPQNSLYRSNLASVLLRMGKVAAARREAEKAIQIDPQSYSANYLLGVVALRSGKFDTGLSFADKAIAINPSFSNGRILKSDVLIAQFGSRITDGAEAKDNLDLLTQSIDNLESAQSENKSRAPDPVLDDKLEASRALYKFFSKNYPPAGVPTPPEPGVTPLKVIKKPKAVYTEKARVENRTGTIRLAVVLGANGRILQIVALSRLGGGLDEQAIAAAGRIEFEPKMINGKAVSAVMMFDYGFDIY